MAQSVPRNPSLPRCGIQIPLSYLILFNFNTFSSENHYLALEKHGIAEQMITKSFLGSVLISGKTCNNFLVYFPNHYRFFKQPSRAVKQTCEKCLRMPANAYKFWAKAGSQGLLHIVQLLRVSPSFTWLGLICILVSNVQHDDLFRKAAFCNRTLMAVEVA